MPALLGVGREQQISSLCPIPRLCPLAVAPAQRPVRIQRPADDVPRRRAPLDEVWQLLIQQRIPIQTDESLREDNQHLDSSLDVQRLGLQEPKLRRSGPNVAHHYDF